MPVIDSLVMLTYLFVHASNTAKSPQLTSAAFSNQHSIPTQYTCYGKGQPIPLSWQNLPKKTHSVAILMKDDDAPRHSRSYHWVVFNIPPKSQFTQTGTLAKNSWGKKDYHPPCPTHGTHHYTIQLYALDITLSKNAAKSSATMHKEMRHHVLGSAKLTGTVESPLTITR